MSLSFHINIKWKFSLENERTGNTRKLQTQHYQNLTGKMNF